MKLSATIGCLFTMLATLAGPVPAQPTQSAPLTGKVLLLENDRLLEGDIERIGDQYRIRRGAGELWIPVARAKRLCKDLDDVYLHMQSQSNLGDPDERLRLARWCQLNGLREKALMEARIAQQMRPDHDGTLQLVQLL